MHGYLHLLGRRLLDRRRAWNLNMQIGRCDRLWNIWRRVNRLLLLLLLRLVLWLRRLRLVGRRLLGSVLLLLQAGIRIEWRLRGRR